MFGIRCARLLSSPKKLPGFLLSDVPNFAYCAVTLRAGLDRADDAPVIRYPALDGLQPEFSGFQPELGPEAGPGFTSSQGIL